MNKLLCSLLTVSLTTAVTAQQLPCWSASLGTNLMLGDDAMSAGQPLGFSFPYGGTTYTDIQVADNGYITLGASGGVSNWNATTAGLVTDPFARICPFWTDLDPSLAGSGNVWFNAVPAAGGLPAHAIVTWLDVYEWVG